MPQAWARAVFVGNLYRDIGDGNPQPVTAAEVNAEWIDLALRGYFGTPPDPEVRRLLRKRLSRPGPLGATYHQSWAERFRELRAELLDGLEFSLVDGEPPLTNLEICLLVAVEDYAAHRGRWRYNPSASKHDGDKAARRVWNAVKPLI